LISEFAIIASGVNIMLTDAKRGVAVIEKTPINQAIRRPKKKVIFCTNHPVSSDMEDGLVDDASFLRNSHARYDNLSSITRKTSWTVRDMQNLLRNHNRPGAICQHGQESLYTMASYILLPEKRKVLMTNGNPCKSKFLEYTFHEETGEKSDAPQLCCGGLLDWDTYRCSLSLRKLKQGVEEVRDQKKK